jgi:hypothetical protein
MAFFETVMVKGYQKLVDQDTVVSVDQGAYAAKQLREIEKDSVGSEQMAEAHAQLARVVRVIREVVPENLHQQIMDILEGREVAPALQAPGRAVEEYDPMVDADDEDFEEEDWENG